MNQIHKKSDELKRRQEAQAALTAKIKVTITRGVYGNNFAEGVEQTFLRETDNPRSWLIVFLIFVLARQVIVCLLILFSQMMESKLLVGGKSIVDKTTEQERALEERRRELAEQRVSPSC